MLEKNIKITKVKIVKINQIKSKLDKENLKFTLLEVKLADNLSMMQEKYKKLQSFKAQNSIRPSFVEKRVLENDHEKGDQNHLGKSKI
jgi:hypothetical protein